MLVVTLVQAAFFSDGTLVPTVSSIFAPLVTIFNFLISSIGVIYIFFVTPWRVFSYIFQKEELPTKNLGVIILASLLIPAMVLFMFAFPLFIPR